MQTYTFDTNAGPIVTLRGKSLAAVKHIAESQIPLLRRRNYSSKWTRSGDWHVVNVFNSKQRLVHAAAIRRTR